MKIKILSAPDKLGFRINLDDRCYHLAIREIMAKDIPSHYEIGAQDIANQQTHAVSLADNFKTMAEARLAWTTGFNINSHSLKIVSHLLKIKQAVISV